MHALAESEKLFVLRKTSVLSANSQNAHTDFAR